MNDSAHTLDYGTRPRSRWRRRAVGVLLVLISIGAAAGAGYAYREPIGVRVDILREQRRCATFTRSATDVVAYVDAQKPTYHHGIVCSFGAPPWRPSPFHDLGRTSDLGEEVVFLHGRRSAAGRHRIVYVRGCSMIGGVDQIVFDYEIFSRAGILADASRITKDACVIGGNFQRMDAAPLTIYAAQPDARDPSRFTIEYERDGVRGIIDGRLTDDDQVRLTVRDGPGRELWRFVESVDSRAFAEAFDRRIGLPADRQRSRRAGT